MPKMTTRTIGRAAPSWLAVLSLTLTVAAAACGGAASGPPSPPPPPPPPAGWDDGIRLRPVVDRNPAPDVVEIDLEARLAQVEVQPGRFVEMWTYGGDVPGPLIRVRPRRSADRPLHQPAARGDDDPLARRPARRRRGRRARALAAGGAAGRQFDYAFMVPDAGLFWYHPHVNSAAQVGDGLYGALLVEPRRRQAPSTRPSLRPPWPRAGDGALRRQPRTRTACSTPDTGGDRLRCSGARGTWLLVNGRVAPTVLARRGQPQRWRIVNAARSRYFQLAMAGHAFTRIGGDGGLFRRPRRRRRWC